MLTRHSKPGPSFLSFLQQDVASQTPVWAACTLRDHQAVACTCRELRAAIVAWLSGQPRICIDLRDATPALGDYAIRYCPSVRVLAIFKEETQTGEWLIDDLRSAPQLQLQVSTEESYLLAPFVAQNQSLDRLVLDWEGSHVEHRRLWISLLSGRAAGLDSQVGTDVSIVASEVPAASFAFAGALLKRNGSVRSLRACDVGLDAGGVEVLMDSLPHVRKLKGLNLSQNNEVSDEAWALLIRTTVLPYLALRTLTLQANGIGAHGASALGELLASTRSLCELDLLGNVLHCEGAAAIAKGLAANSSLKTLNLRSNRIGDDGAQQLGLALATNRTLRGLLLSWNRIGDRGACALANGLSANGELRELALLENEITDVGAHALREGLQTNGTLSCCSLQCNLITHSIVAGLEAWLASIHHDEPPPLSSEESHTSDTSAHSAGTAHETDGDE